MLKKSKIYTANGELFEINKTINGAPFFRKEFYNDNNNEVDIVSKIKSCNLKNVVKIYNVSYTFYDAEIVDILIPNQITEEQINKIIHDMKNAKNELQNNGIIYIDWKTDNLGYSEEDKVYKVFDFDSSGIISSQHKEWMKQPPHRWLYKKAFEKGLTLPLDIDNECFNIFCNELKQLKNSK